MGCLEPAPFAHPRYRHPRKAWDCRCSSHTQGMETPMWVVPPARQVNDLHWLAYRLFTDQGQSEAGGIAATLGWIHGDRVGPITERDEQPVTRALAHVEIWAAFRVDDEFTDDPEPSLRSTCDRWGVVYWPVVATDPRWANGVWRTLHWLVETVK